MRQHSHVTREHHKTRPQQDREGSALLIVMVLLAMLAGLGVIFYMFSAQERKSAEFYSEAAKAPQYDLSVDTLMDFGLEQLIVGPNFRYRNSALFGRRHSLLPNMLGLDTTGQYIDLTPFNGVPFDPVGTALRDPLYFAINDSPVANNGYDPNYAYMANADPDYTYPDGNNVFISYTGFEPTSGNLVIIPSFHRPQNLRGFASWYSDPLTTQRVLRPHPNHQYVPPAGQQFNNTYSRFIQDAEAVTLWGAGATGFPFQPNDQNANGTNDQGVWSGSSTYEYDVDNNGDGTREGIWMDLDFPVQESLDGKQYVPMYSMTVIDADALLNLNVHGNMARVWNGDLGLTTPFMNTPADPSVSKSNTGAMPSEVNPMWGLNRRPLGSSSFNDGTYLADGFYGPANPLSWFESGNRELGFLLMGRYSTSPTDLVPGRWGEDSFLYKAITNGTSRTTYAYAFDSSGNPLANPWPGPGQTQVDDNGDAQQVVGGFYGSTFTPFGHPMDYTGLGSYFTGKIGNYGSASVARWPSYSRYSNGTPVVGWTEMSNSIQNALINDGAESVVDADKLRTDDAQFGPDEMRALFMSNTDFQTAAGGSSRLTSLAPFNIDATDNNFPTSGKNTQFFRSKFTTRSWDRKQFSLAYSATNRPWEYSADANSNGKLEFPPLFCPTYTTPGVFEYTSTDLYRPVTRALLETELNNNSQIRRSLRLSANALLVGPNGNPYPTIPTTRPPNINLSFRPLTPHPDPTLLTAAPITPAIQAAHNPVQSSYPANGNFSGDAQLQEYWARVDRQLLARDIFGLLFAMGWPDGINPSNITYPSLTFTTLVFDTSAQGVLNQQMVRQMAQFAVNLVDSLDRDNIPTRFEYDMDPRDGWGLDDDPYTTSEPSRGEVWGVERLDLTLSEALVVTAPAQASDISFTQWNDINAQNFAFVELRNPGPNSVDLSSKAWRVDVGPEFVTTAAPDQVRRLKLLNGTIAAGTLFTIGSADRTTGGANPSIMKVAHAGTAPGNWDTDQTSWVAPAQQPLSLDLKNAADAARFNLLDATGSAPATGALFDGGTLTDIYVRLYRRANPTRVAPSTASEEADNPFILVDQIHIDNVQTDTRGAEGGKLALKSSDTQAAIEACLANLKSLQTREPFYGTGRTARAVGTPPYYANTFAADNTPTVNGLPAYFTRWQKVFDRDFASMGEVLQLTLGGFSNTDDLRTRFTASASDPMAVPIPVAGDSASTEDYFVKPQPSVPLSMLASRWYRILELIDVPTREHVGIPGLNVPLDFPRVPGKINVNMMRHPEVAAALVDDPSVMTVLMDEDANFNGVLDPGEDLNGNGTMDTFNPPLVIRNDLTVATPSPYPVSISSWWQGLLFARDGSRTGGGTIQPDSTSGLYLPGVSTARPFRSLANAIENPTNATASFTRVEDTILRSWPDDAINMAAGGSNDPRQLFELGTADEHRGADTSAAPVATLDPYVRRRILSKLMNNTTTRSNVFVVFMSVKNFRADVSTGAVRIGGPLTGNAWEPDHRGFFVIDRTQLEKAYDPSTNSFNFRSFIEFRQILQ